MFGYEKRSFVGLLIRWSSVRIAHDPPLILSINYQLVSAKTLNLDKAATEHWKVGIGTDIQTKDGWTGSFGYEREQAIGSGHSDSLKLDAKLKF